MQIFSSWSERHAHITRWILLAGWSALIASLLTDFDLWSLNVNHCGSLPECHHHVGNQIFWGTVVPSSLFILVVMSHELWRRICPLAFVSQLFRGVGWQRSAKGKWNRRNQVRIESDSWLGKNYFGLQWTLFIAGLSLRLLVVNSSTLGLGLFLLVTAIAAIFVGWAYGGKAWCQYFCPMAPVQTIITGPRSLFGSPGHMDTNSNITQSICRTIDEKGNTKSACVACQSPCIDIDSEKTYWNSFNNTKNIRWAWYSYPGIVLSFFLLIKAESRGNIDYLRSGMWAYDLHVIDKINDPLIIHGFNTVLPRLISLPLLLVVGGTISVILFNLIEYLIGYNLRRNRNKYEELAGNRTRLLSSFIAVNIFFWFADPSLGLLGPKVGQIIRSIVLVASGMWLYRGWFRNKLMYQRESMSGNLRKKLNIAFPNFGRLKDGRSLRDLNSDEIYILAKIMPGYVNKVKKNIYREMIMDIFRWFCNLFKKHPQ